MPLLARSLALGVVELVKGLPVCRACEGDLVLETCLGVTAEGEAAAATLGLPLGSTMVLMT